MKFTVMYQTSTHVEADDEVEAAKQVQAALPEGTFVQGIQVLRGHQPFPED